MWIIRLRKAAVHVAGPVSHLEVMYLSAGRFREDMEDRRAIEVRPELGGMRRYDTVPNPVACYIPSR